MADAILMAGGTGGVSSDDVTAGKAQVLQGYKTVTTDSNDEVVEGTIPKRGTWSTASEVVNASGESTVHVRFEEGYYNKDGQYKPTAKIPYAVLSNVLGIDANKMLDSLTVAGVRGTIPIRGYRGPNCTEIFMYQADGGYVVRIEEGYYHKSGQWKPYVVVPPTLMKSAVNYHPEKTLSDTRTCEEQGQIKMVNTQDNNYAVNQAKLFGMDPGRGKLVMQLGHGNAYYYRNDNSPHVEVDASALGTAGSDSVLQGQTATSQIGIKFGGTIPRWICTTGDVITAHNVSSYGQGFAWDDVHAGRGRGIVVGIPNRHYIQGANWVFLPSPNLYPWNIRAGVNIHGITGTLQDYGAGRMVFRGATFDGTIATGVAKKGFVLNGINRYYDLRDALRRCEGVNDGGIKMLNTYSQNTRHRSAEDIGCVLSNSINLTPFRWIKVGFVVFNFKGDGTASQPAQIELETGVVSTAEVGGEVAQPFSDYPVRVLGGRSKFISHVMVSTSRNAGNLSDKAQKYLTLDVSDLQGQYFLYFLLGNIEHEYSMGWVHATVLINSIEVIN